MLLKPRSLTEKHYMKQGLPPLINEHCRILILGSLPGDKSIYKKEYYFDPRNQFWDITEFALSIDMNVDYTTRCENLFNNHIALWDVVNSADRKGSLDSNIKNEQPNDIPSFLNWHPYINIILFNGKKAEEIYRKYFKHIAVPTLTLPSTSSTPGSNVKTHDEKSQLWAKAINK